MGYCRQRADERHDNQGNQEPLVVREKPEDPQVSLW